MNHSDYAYLLYKAHLLWDLECKAADKGETFTPSNHFDPIAIPDVEAQARIFRLSASSCRMLVLCLRFPKNLQIEDEKLDGVAWAFFDGRQTTKLVSSEDPNYKYRLYCADFVPPSVIPV